MCIFLISYQINNTGTKVIKLFHLAGSRLEKDLNKCAYVRHGCYGTEIFTLFVIKIFIQANFSNKQRLWHIGYSCNLNELFHYEGCSNFWKSQQMQKF